MTGPKFFRLNSDISEETSRDPTGTTSVSPPNQDVLFHFSTQNCLFTRRNPKYVLTFTFMAGFAGLDNISSMAVSVDDNPCTLNYIQMATKNSSISENFPPSPNYILIFELF